MKKKKLTFKTVYMCYLIVLVVAVAAALIYVSALLRRYEEWRPETRVQEVVEQLAADALASDFWKTNSLPAVEAGEYETDLDVQGKYLELYQNGEATFVQKGGNYPEDELHYFIVNQGVNLAEVTLKAVGPTVTKLAILNMREWEIASVKPMVEVSEYTISLPDDFALSVNGVALAKEEGVEEKDNKITYTVNGVYLEPEFSITNHEGKTVDYTVKNKKVVAEFYDYSLTLPTMLKVEVNGEQAQGQPVGNNRVNYIVRSLEKPDVIVSDYYGNTVTYEGGNHFPLTYMTVTADSKYTVNISGEPVAAEAVTISSNAEYDQLADYVENLPQNTVYDIAILKDDVQVSVVDEQGNATVLDNAKTIHDFTATANALETVPDSVSDEVDVLDIAQKWSLFMSDDLAFSKVKQHLIADSYQYKVAVQYATGVDITFTSSHTLCNPTFTDEAVTNFVWITDDCFSVDISFVKHMLVRGTTQVDDAMNDRFYFVKYDDTDDNKDNPEWKIASMKEIVSNE